MFMRITDKLERKLHDDIEELNNTFSNTIEGNANFELYVNFLELINIKKPYYKDKTTSQLVLRDLNGVEKKRLFERINLPLMFPELENGSTLNEIWTDSSLPSVDSANDITPYMHVFASHLHEHINNLKKKGLNFNSFSMQGLEFLNCLDIRCFHRSTSKKGAIIKQLINKRSRVEILNFNKDLPRFFTANRRTSEREINSSDSMIDDQPDINDVEGAVEKHSFN